MNNPHPLTQITFLGPSLRKLYGLKKICFPIAFLIYTALQITGLQIFTELNILSLINTSPNTLSLTVLQEDQGPGLHRLHLLSYNMANMHIVIPLTNMENTHQNYSDTYKQFQIYLRTKLHLNSYVVKPCKHLKVSHTLNSEIQYVHELSLQILMWVIDILIHIAFTYLIYLSYVRNFISQYPNNQMEKFPVLEPLRILQASHLGNGRAPRDTYEVCMAKPEMAHVISIHFPL